MRAALWSRWSIRTLIHVVVRVVILATPVVETAFPSPGEPLN